MTHGSWPMQPNGESNQDVCSYGNSSLRFGVTKLSPKRGVVATTEGNGWSRAARGVQRGRGPEP